MPRRPFPRVSPKVHQHPDSRPLTRAQGLNVAADVIQSLRGYRKTPDYRTLQSDLNFLCDVLRRASAGETNIGRPTEVLLALPPLVASQEFPPLDDPARLKRAQRYSSTWLASR
jgi:hypothetical protein